MTFLYEEKEGKRQILISQDKAPSASGSMIAFAVEDIWNMGKEKELNYIFHKPVVGSKVRERHLEIFKVKEAFSQAKYEEALELLGTPSSLSMKSLYMLILMKLERWRDAYVFSGKTMDDFVLHAKDDFSLNSFRRLHLISSVLYKGQEASRSLAKKYFLEGKSDSELKKLSSQIISEDIFNYNSKDIVFDFFSASIKKTAKVTNME